MGGESVPTRGASASSGRMVVGDNVEGGRERDNSLGPVSGSLLVPGTTLGVHRPHSRMLMQAREEVKNARVMTGLLRDSLLLSHDEASARLAEVFCFSTHYNTLQRTPTQCNTLQYTATHCNTLQSTTTHCNPLQHTATRCNTPRPQCACVCVCVCVCVRAARLLYNIYMYIYIYIRDQNIYMYT